MNLVKAGEKDNIFLYFTAFVLASTISFFIFRDTNFILHSLKEISFSKATLEKTDIHFRANLAYLVILFISLSTLINSFILRYIFVGQKLLTPHIRSFFIVLSAMIFPSIYLDVVRHETSFTTYLLSFGFISTLLVLLAQRNKIREHSSSNTISVLLFSFAISVLLSFIAGLYYETTTINKYILVQLPLFIILSITGFQFSNIKKCLSLYSGIITIISLFMLVFFILNDFRYFRTVSGSLHLLTTVSITVSIIIRGLSYYLTRFLHLNTQKITVPFLLLSAVFLWNTTFPYYVQSKDVFELANPANAMMNVFNFGKIPLVDFFTSHMLSEQWYGLLYFFLHGYDGSMDFMSYSFLNDIPVVLLVWYLLQKIFSNTVYALAFILFFPLSGLLFFKHIFICLAGFIILDKALNNRSTFQIFLFFTAIAFLIVWRLDTGIAFLYSLVLYLPFRLYTSPVKFNYRSIANASFGFLLLCCILVVFAVMLRGPEYLMNHFLSALHYVTRQQEHGLHLLAWSDTHHLYFLYIGLPLVALGSALFMAIQLKNTTDKSRFFLWQYSAFFLFTFLTNFQRSTVRHSFLMEMDNLLMSTFVLGMMLFIIGKFSDVNKPNRSFLLLYTGSFISIFSIKYHGISAEAPLNNLYKSFSDKTNLYSQNNKTRTIADTTFMATSVDSIRRFLDTNISTSSTFLDFSNTPLLYYYTQREIPGYFCQSLQNTVGDFSQLQHISKVKSMDVPIVIYSNSPPGWGDKIDDIPNMMRYYLINEFIYQNYRPYGVINQKEFWIKKDFAVKDSSMVSGIKEISNTALHYRYSSSRNAEYLLKTRPDFLEFFGNLKSKDTLSIELIFDLTSEFQENQKVFLLFSYQQA
ncbi:MAG: hypothetical protein IPF52_10200 [Saprospiraceae bacterium]|nr:hypothetical protein [Saprospiraceae bacterium]